MNSKYCDGHFQSRKTIFKDRSNEKNLEFLNPFLNADEAKVDKSDVQADRKATAKMHDSWFTRESEFLSKIPKATQFDKHIKCVSSTRIEPTPLILAEPVTPSPEKKVLKDSKQPEALSSPKKKKASSKDLPENQVDFEDFEQPGEKKIKKKKKKSKDLPSGGDDTLQLDELGSGKKKKKTKKKTKLDLEAMGPEELEEVIKRKTKKLIASELLIAAEKKKQKKNKKQKKEQRAIENKEDEEGLGANKEFDDCPMSNVEAGSGYESDRSRARERRNKSPLSTAIPTHPPPVNEFSSKLMSMAGYRDSSSESKRGSRGGGDELMPPSPKSSPKLRLRSPPRSGSKRRSPSPPPAKSDRHRHPSDRPSRRPTHQRSPSPSFEHQLPPQYNARTDVPGPGSRRVGGPRTPSPKMHQKSPRRQHQGPRTPPPGPRSPSEPHHSPDLEQQHLHHGAARDRGEYLPPRDERQQSPWRPSSPGGFRPRSPPPVHSYHHRDRRYSRSPSPPGSRRRVPPPLSSGRHRHRGASPLPRHYRSPSPPPYGRSHRHRRSPPPPPASFGRHSSPRSAIIGGVSPPRSRIDETYYFRDDREGNFQDHSIPDSTISDAELLASRRSVPSNYSESNSVPKYPGGINSSQISRHHSNQQSEFSSSPKRLSLDERLEKEHGIKVQEEQAAAAAAAAQQHHRGEEHQPDFSRPPPGYALGAGTDRSKRHSASNFQSGRYPSYPPEVPAASSVVPPPQAVINPPPMDTPEEGRLVRVGNMLQIVPDSKPPAAAPVPPPPAQQQQQQPQPLPPTEGNTASALMKKMEDMKKKKDAERRMKREQRMAERMQQHQDGNVAEINNSELENVSRGTKVGRILETIEREEEEDLEAKEAKLLQEAICSVPEMDADEGIIISL